MTIQIRRILDIRDLMPNSTIGCPRLLNQRTIILSDYRQALAAATSVTGCRVLVTGGGGGIGRAICRCFAASGAWVMVTDLQAEAAEETRQLCLSDGAAAEHLAACCLDVCDTEQLSRAVEATTQALGGLNVLVNNAGIFRPSPLDAPDFDRVWRESFDVLLDAQKSLIRLALPALRQADYARILNIASTEGLGATPDHAAYVAAKHAVIGLTRAMAVDLGSEGITVNAICPGPIHTGITEKIGAADKARFAHRRTALRRYGTSEEIAHAALSLAQPGASYVTGAQIVVDGGLTVRNA